MSPIRFVVGSILATAAVGCSGADTNPGMNPGVDAAVPRLDGASDAVAPIMDTNSPEPAITGGRWPALDCTTGGGDYCIALAVTINGEQAEFTCLPSNRDIVSLSAARWAINCHDAAGRLNLRVSAPVRGVGSFVFVASEVQTADSTLELLKLSDETKRAQLNSKAPNLIGAEVKETVSADGVHVGTFAGSWRVAEADCRSFVYSCAAGELRGSFLFR
jgi:hypothetical protein